MSKIDWTKPIEAIYSLYPETDKNKYSAECLCLPSYTTENLNSRYVVVYKEDIDDCLIFDDYGNCISKHDQYVRIQNIQTEKQPIDWNKPILVKNRYNDIKSPAKVVHTFEDGKRLVVYNSEFDLFTDDGRSDNGYMHDVYNPAPKTEKITYVVHGTQPSKLSVNRKDFFDKFYNYSNHTIYNVFTIEVEVPDEH